jgi:hypothetical protein
VLPPSSPAPPFPRHELIKLGIVIDSVLTVISVIKRPNSAYIHVYNIPSISLQLLMTRTGEYKRLTMDAE